MSYLSKRICNHCNFSLNNNIWKNLSIINKRNAAFSFESDTFDYSNLNNVRRNNDESRKMTFERKNFDSKFKKFQKQDIQWSRENLTPFQKEFYQEHPNVKQMPDSEVQKIREESRMNVFGKSIPKPFRTFDESGIPSHWLKYLDKLGIEEPTPIQQQGIPIALSGRDVVGISRTGSGKTLSYLLPCLVHISAQPIVKKGEGPISLILAPTRELASQIGTEIKNLIQVNPSIPVKYCTVYGGTDRNSQVFELQKSPDILVATPGRLMDLLESGITNFKRTTYCVLDEADRMLDMGFRDDIETILSYIRPDKQTLMWSATWPTEIQSIALQYMTNPIRVQIGSTDLVANSNIKQVFRCIQNENTKLETLIKDCEELMKENKKILIFTNRRKTSDFLEIMLEKKNYQFRNKVKAIHGDKSQSSRERILRDFRSNNLRILIATDVVARGIDVTDIDCVIVYDFPTDIQVYVHRIGRTARGNKQGLSLSYLNFDDIDNYGSKLIQVLQKAKQPIPKWLQLKLN